MFGNKKKMSKEELTAARELRMNTTADKLNMQISAMEKKQNALLDKLVEARRKGLKAQEEQARGLLGRCLASKKRAEGMLMTLELARESRDLAELNYQFLECIGDLSDDITIASGKTKAKKTEKKFTKALYKASEQTKQMDEFLESGDYAATASVGVDNFSDFDEEIDALLQDAESNQRTTNTSRKRDNL
jgi:hypothetical protein